VDRAHEPDVKHDLESFPWPWADSSIDEIRAHHVLEHLGADFKTFVGVMKEMHRVCKNGAVLEIVVPHPRHDDFLNDPTHVRPITLNVLSLFSRTWNTKWEKDGSANTKLAFEYGIDFEPKEEAFQLEQRVQDAYDRGQINQDGLVVLMKERNNIVKAIHLKLECVK
jgi:SAM-dependent methyltransferase